MLSELFGMTYEFLTTVHCRARVLEYHFVFLAKRKHGQSTLSVHDGFIW